MRSEVLSFNKTQRAEMFDFHAGDVVKVHRRIIEGEKERTQVFEGMIIAIKGRQSSSPMLTVRKVSNGVGVEIVVPFFSPSIEKVELVKRAKVRKSKLYYIRDKAAKALRFKFTDATEILPEGKEVNEEVVVEEKTTDDPVAEKDASSDETPETASAEKEEKTS